MPRQQLALANQLLGGVEGGLEDCGVDVGAGVANLQQAGEGKVGEAAGEGAAVGESGSNRSASVGGKAP